MRTPADVMVSPSDSTNASQRCRSLYSENCVLRDLLTSQAAELERLRGAFARARC